MCSPTQVFDELYAAHYQQVFRRVYRLLGGPREEVEDLTQQTFLKAWRALPTLSHTGFLPWLYCIANRLALDCLRQRALRHQQVSISTATDQEEVFVEERDRYETVLARIDVGTALRQLPRHHRRALLYSAHGYSLQEIMDLMHCSHTTARMMVYRGRLALKRQYQEGGAYGSTEKETLDPLSEVRP
jgi:RNA polymerase sigma-70 factor, ECF subfamily